MCLLGLGLTISYQTSFVEHDHGFFVLTKLSTMETIPLLGRDGAPPSPKDKYRYKRRSVVRILGRLRDAMSNCWLFQNNHTSNSWEDSEEFDASNQKGLLGGSGRTMFSERTSSSDSTCFHEESYGKSNDAATAKKNKDIDIRTRGAEGITRGRSRRMRDAVRSQEEESTKTCDVSDEESNSVKRVRFTDDVEQRAARSSESPLVCGSISNMRPTFTIFPSWHVPFRHTLNSLNNRLQSFSLMLPTNGDRSGAFPTADGAFPIFVPNSHEIN